MASVRSLTGIPLSKWTVGPYRSPTKWTVGPFLGGNDGTAFAGRRAQCECAVPGHDVLRHDGGRRAGVRRARPVRRGGWHVRRHPPHILVLGGPRHPRGERGGGWA